MSLDFSIEKVLPVEVFSRNYTHNVSRMWREANVYVALYQSEGMKAGDLIQSLKDGLFDMQTRPEVYQKMNPENGWGDYETAVVFLEGILRACEANPDGIVRISA